MSTGGLSKARLGRMHDVMAGYVARGEVPGLVTLISRRGEVHVDAIGMKASDSGRIVMLNPGLVGGRYRPRRITTGSTKCSCR